MRFCFAVLALGLAAMSANAFAQEDEHGHAGDVEFGYNDLLNPTALTFEAGELTTDGIAFFEGSFEELDPLFDAGNFSADEPGFETNELDDLLVNEGDSIFLKFLDASLNSATGVGFVNFYNPLTGKLEPTGRLAIIDNTDTGTADLILNGGEIESGDNPQFLGVSAIEQGDTVPEVHDHVVIDLLDDDLVGANAAQSGAYGVMLQLQSNNASIGDSDPFWLILNYGLSEPEFEGSAVPAFTGVPEPGSLSLFALGLTSLAMRRRR